MEVERNAATSEMNGSNCSPPTHPTAIPVGSAEGVHTSSNVQQTPAPATRLTRSTANPDSPLQQLPMAVPIARPVPAPAAISNKPAAPRPPREVVPKPPSLMLQKLTHVDFASAASKDLQMASDDSNDEMLMRVCSALASCENRPLSPKEISEVMLHFGWRNTTGQPFALVSTSIRAHLKRRGYVTPPSIHNKHPTESPSIHPPLIWCCEITGPIHEEDKKLIGIDPEGDMVVKRGLLWYLAPETGFPAPFSIREPNIFPRPKQADILAEPNLRSPKTVINTRRSSATSILPDDSVPMDTEADEDAMGRGKRKRKASAIAGGDSAWQAAPALSMSAPANTSPFFTAGRSPSASLPALPTIAEDHGNAASPKPCLKPSRRADSEDSTLSTTVSSCSTAPPRRIKVRLFGETKSGAPPTSSKVPEPMPVLSKPIDQEEDEDEDGEVVEGSEMEDMPDIVAMERRRFKKRSKSDGSLFTLTTGPSPSKFFRNSNFFRHTSDFYAHHSASVPTQNDNLWSLFRSPLEGGSAKTSVASISDLHARALEDDATESSDEMDLDGMASRAARPEDADHDFYQSMLAETSSSHANNVSTRNTLFANYSLRDSIKTSEQSKPTITLSPPLHDGTFSTSISPDPDLREESPAYHSTPSTTPRSSISVKAEAEYYEVAQALDAAEQQDRQRQKDRPSSPDLRTKVKIESDVTLSDSLPMLDVDNVQEKDPIKSPAGELPALPLMNAAITAGFAPARGSSAVLDGRSHPTAHYQAAEEGDYFAKPEEDDEINSNSIHSRGQSLDTSNRFVSPFSTFASPSPAAAKYGTEGTQSGAASPACWSDSDSFDVECVTGGQDFASPVADQLSPFAMDYDDMMSSCEDIHELDEASLRVDIPQILHMDDFNTELGGRCSAVSCGPSASLRMPPTPFGPETFSFMGMSVSDQAEAQPNSIISCQAITMDVDDDALPVSCTVDPATQEESTGKGDQQGHSLQETNRSQAVESKGEVLNVRRRRSVAGRKGVEVEHEAEEDQAEEIGVAPARSTRSHTRIGSVTAKAAVPKEPATQNKRTSRRLSTRPKR